MVGPAGHSQPHMMPVMGRASVTQRRGPAVLLVGPLRLVYESLFRISRQTTSETLVPY